MPGSVSRCRGRLGSGSSLRPSRLTYSRSAEGSPVYAGPQTSVISCVGRPACRGAGPGLQVAATRSGSGAGRSAADLSNAYRRSPRLVGFYTMFSAETHRQAAVFDAIGERYDDAFPHKSAQIIATQWIIDRLAPGARVLDLGCGTGVLRPGGYFVVGMVEGDLDHAPLTFLGQQVLVTAYPRAELEAVFTAEDLDVREVDTEDFEPVAPDVPPERQIFLYCRAT